MGLFDLWGGIGTIAIDAVVTYALAYYVDGTLMPWFVFVFLMGHMSISHIWRQRLNDPGVTDITGPQMVLIMRLHAFSWNVHDGRIKPELLTDHQKDRAIHKMPEFLDYAGYVCFFPSLWAGPSFDYNDYKRWLQTTMFDVAPGERAPPTKKQRKIPRSGTPAAWKAGAGLGWIFLFLQMSKWYSTSLILAPGYTQNYRFLRRVFHLQMLGFTTRLKYYGVWSLAEGACILSGMGYNGLDASGNPRWDRLNNVSPWSIESAQNSRAYLEGWNKNTNNWLRNYVYLRVTPKGKKPGFGATLLTFGTSAFWHGFYPGYYLTFVLAAFIQTVAKNFRRYVRPFFLTPDGKKGTSHKVYYDIMSYVVTQLAFCFTTTPFVMLGLKESLQAWAQVYFYTVLGVAASLAFFASPAKVMLISKINKRNHPHVRKTVQEETEYMPALGLPNDPGREIDNAIDEVKADFEMRRRRGSAVTMPNGKELRAAVERKLGRSLKVGSGEGSEKGKVVDVGGGKEVKIS